MSGRGPGGLHGLTRRRALGYVALPLLPTICGAAGATPARLALVIGNSAYTDSDPLPNASADAAKIAERLGRLGFHVEDGTTDLGRKGLNDVVKGFGQKLRAAGPDVVSFVYYAGHAAQDGYGVNYLLPVDAKARTPAEIRNEGTPVQPLLKDMEEANNQINIFVLDACRDWYKSERTPKDPRGLHDMGLHASILIAFATRPDDTADEGPGLNSSPFSHRLIQALERHPMDPLNVVFDDVKSQVYADTDTAQFPIFVNGLAVARWRLDAQTIVDTGERVRPPMLAAPISDFLQNLDRARLVKFTRGSESLVDTLLKRRDILEGRHIDTPLRLAHFLAAVGFETGGFRAQEERFGYSAARLQTLFPQRFPIAEIAQRYAGKPEMVANRLYAGRLANGDEASGDGWRYRGRGLFFITGKYNYKRYGDLVGVDLVSAPDLANDLEISVAVAAAVWDTLGANGAADRDDIAEVTRRFQGVQAAPGPRAIWLAQAKTAVGM